MSKDCCEHFKVYKLGLFFVLLFTVCFLWYYLIPVEKILHESLFKLSFLGFTGMNILSFLLGAIQSFFWAYIFYGLWKISGLKK